MKKKFLAMLFAGTILTAAGAFGIAGCTNEPEPHTHSFENYVYDNNATCTEDGTETAKCAFCEETDTRTKVGSKTGHTYNKKVATAEYLKTEATTTHRGVYYYSCACGEKGTETFEYGNNKNYTKGLKFALNSSKTAYEVTGIGTAAAKNIVIPIEYENLPVTRIGEYAFSHCSTLTGITIPDGVKSIGSSAFNGCDALTNITIPDSVTVIDEHVFNSCDALKNITIGNGMKSIGHHMFSGCSALTNITIPNSVKSIGVGAFSYCTSLTSIDIPDSVTEIGEYAFSVCTSLANIVIPDSVTKIDKYTFSDCSALVSITIPDSVTTIGSRAFEGCSSITSITIPDSVTKINEYAFHDCDALKNITIGNGLTSIGNYSFLSCSALSNVTIPDSVTKIGEHAFSYCTSLTSVTVPNYVTRIGEYAFSYCTSLTSVTIPDSVKGIGEYAFDGCPSLSIYCEPSLKPSGWNNNWDSAKHCPTIWSYKNNDKDNNGYAYYVIDGIRYSLKDGAATVIRQPNNIKTANIPSAVNYKNNDYSVTGIDDFAFSDCTALSSIDIPNSITNIGELAFYNCSALTEITIPDSVTEIKNRTFFKCSALTSLTIPKGIIEINGNAFGYCTSLANITVASDNAKYHSDGNCLIETATRTLILGCNNSVIPADGSVMRIGNSAFSDCSSLTNVTIPDCVNSIGTDAFSGCTRIIQTENGVSYVDKWVIDCDTSVTQVQLRTDTKGIAFRAFCLCHSLTSITIPDGVKNINYEAFTNCTLLSTVIIPDSVTSIGRFAFGNCSALTTITFKGTKAQWKAISKESHWYTNTDNYTIQCSDGKLDKNGNEIE